MALSIKKQYLFQVCRGNEDPLFQFFSAMRKFDSATYLIIKGESKMRPLKKTKEWLRRLKEDMQKESVSQMKGAPASCCSKPIVTMTRKKK